MGFLGNRDFSRSDENQIWDFWEIDIFRDLTKINHFRVWEVWKSMTFFVVENSFLFDLQYFHYTNVLLCVPYHVSRITFVCIIVCTWLELE
jgi:hypothetical protein